MSPWKVIPFMLVIAAFIGYRACKMVELDDRDVQRRIESGAP